MPLKRKILKSSLLLIIIVLLNGSSYSGKIENNKINNNYNYDSYYQKEIDEEYLMQLIIPKIGLQRKIYNLDSSKNTVKKNIELLKESTLFSDDNYHIFLAAHSGNSYISYFRKLNKLALNDIVKLIYNNTIYTYKVIFIKEEEKKDYILTFNNQPKMLTLITCIGKEKRLIIDLEEINKESNNIENIS